MTSVKPRNGSGWINRTVEVQPFESKLLNGQLFIKLYTKKLNLEKFKNESIVQILNFKIHAHELFLSLEISRVETFK